MRCPVAAHISGGAAALDAAAKRQWGDIPTEIAEKRDWPLPGQRENERTSAVARRFFKSDIAGG